MIDGLEPHPAMKDSGVYRHSDFASSRLRVNIELARSREDREREET